MWNGEKARHWGGSDGFEREGGTRRRADPSHPRSTRFSHLVPLVPFLFSAPFLSSIPTHAFFLFSLFGLFSSSPGGCSFFLPCFAHRFVSCAPVCSFAVAYFALPPPPLRVFVRFGCHRGGAGRKEAARRLGIPLLTGRGLSPVCRFFPHTLPASARRLSFSRSHRSPFPSFCRFLLPLLLFCQLSFSLDAHRIAFCSSRFLGRCKGPIASVSAALRDADRGVTPNAGAVRRSSARPDPLFFFSDSLFPSSSAARAPVPLFSQPLL